MMLSGRIYCSAAEPKQYYFQNGGTSNQLEMLYLNDYIQFYLLFMIIIITWLFYMIIYNYYNKEDLHMQTLSLVDMSHGSTIEIIWTLVPAVILGIIAIPAFKVLYSLDQAINTNVTVKCIGSQWYWSYSINDHSFCRLISSSFDSYMVSTDQLEMGDLRLCEVDNPLILPANSLIRFVITSTDVIHSFSVPGLGIKLDAVPGRLNQCSALINRYGVFYGACQEICGIQHAFMPIKVISTDFNNFLVNTLRNM